MIVVLATSSLELESNVMSLMLLSPVLHWILPRLYKPFIEALRLVDIITVQPSIKYWHLIRCNWKRWFLLSLRKLNFRRVDLWGLPYFERSNFLSLHSLAIICLMTTIDLSVMMVKLLLLRRFRVNKSLPIGPSYWCIDVTVRHCFMWPSGFSDIAVLDGFSMRINLTTLIIVLWLAKGSKLLISYTCKVLEIRRVFSADVCRSVNFLLSGAILLLTWDYFLCLLLRFYI